MYGKDVYEINRKAVLSSQIVAKATIRRASGALEIAVVFRNSTRQEFYWVFKVRSPRSPRRSWKLVNYFGRDAGFGNTKPYADFASFIQYYARIHQAAVVSTRTPMARRLAGMLQRTRQESIHNDWAERTGEVRSEQVKRVNQKLERGRAGRLWWMR